MKILLAFLALLVAVSRIGLAQDPVARDNDPLFPASGDLLVTTATGIPYIAIAEVAYGFGDRFSVGVVAGVTPVIPGYGIRPRVVLSESASWKLYYRMPILYYPKTVELGGEPWILTWPLVASEWRLSSGVRLSAQGGIVGAACVESLLGMDAEPMAGMSDHAGHGEHGGHDAHHDDVAMAMGFEGNLWNTLGAGVSIPIRSTTTFTAEAHLVLEGLSLAGESWIGGPSEIVVLGVTQAF